MRQFVLFGSLLLIAASVDAKKGEKEDKGMIIRCMAENYMAGEEQIKACRECYQNIGDLMSESGLAAAKQCTQQYLPLSNEACAEQISQLTTANIEDQGEEVIDCFDETLETKNYERCIGESTSETTEEKMVDGVMCVLKSWKYGMEYVKNATMAGKNNKRGRPGRRGKGKKGKMGMKEKMLMIAHCANANQGDDSRQEQCKTCFMNAVKPPRNPRARANAKDAILSAVTGCSEEFLAPKYEQCTAMLKDKTGEKEGIMGCYIRVLVSNLVQSCSSGVTEVTAETLDTTMECGKDKVKQFAMKNASPKMLEKLAKMFDDDSGEDDDDA